VLSRLLQWMPPETAHAVALRLLRWRRDRPTPTSDRLATRLAGLPLANPVGLAAGLDKNATALRGLASLGFGFIEFGTVTPRPQPGNPRPRVFRLREDEAIINRLGFNNLGLDAVTRELERAGPIPVPIGANIGMNRDTPDPVVDYRLGVRRLHPLVDYITVNLSSPNTPGLRALQHGDALRRLLDGVLEERASLADRPRPLFVKLSPDIPESDLDDLVGALESRWPDGLIIGNTTLARPPGLRSPHRTEPGGLSGRPLAPIAARALSAIASRVGGRIPLVAVGGIADAATARDRLHRGATAVQLYTALTYQGPGLIHRLVRDLDSLLAQGGPGSDLTLDPVAARL
jgi:dihydroorotate dehydrogenase